MVFWQRRTLKPEETEKFIEKIQAFFERYFGLWKTWCIFTKKSCTKIKRMIIPGRFCIIRLRVHIAVRR